MSDPKQLQALVVYESMFGCTEEIAYAVAEGLRIEGIAVEVTDVRDGSPADEVDVDLLVVGAPTHAFSLSRPSTRADALRQGARLGTDSTGLREWLDARRSLAVPEGGLAAAFDTRATKVRRLPKAASTRAAHLLVRQGYRLVSRPTPFVVEGTSGPLASGEVDRAVAWGRVIARKAMRES
jgi:hypothetical protein